jgi:hypothetical protein
VSKRAKKYATWLYERVVQFLNFNNVKIIMTKKGEVVYDNGRRLDGWLTGSKEGNTIILISNPGAKFKPVNPEHVVLHEVFHEFFTDASHAEIDFIIDHILKDLNEAQKSILKSYIKFS